MDIELIQLRGTVGQLRAEDERLRQERVATALVLALSDNTTAGPSASGAAEGTLAATERLVCIPRDRKCPGGGI